MIGVREKSKALDAVTDSLSGNSAKRYNWLEWDATQFIGKFVSYPERESVPENFNDQAVVELYNK
jgi:small subunit ribosomal protein S4